MVGHMCLRLYIFKPFQYMLTRLTRGVSNILKWFEGYYQVSYRTYLRREPLNLFKI